MPIEWSLRTLGQRCVWVTALMGVLGAAAATAAEPPILPADSGARFLGVETCGSSACHASREAWGNATVSMKERLIWQAHDAHAKAFTGLTAAAGKGIATKLGLADASQAPECLVCHTTFVPAAQRGPLFDLRSGVGCESCHGPGASFLSAHVQPTAQHASNIAAGMYPTNQPAARAALCLSCHQGDTVRKMTHAIYGAGHPRLRFELDTYGALQPYHFVADADYRRRKPTASHFRLWAEGQLRAAQQLLAQAEAAHGRGVFPELANYDCHACHRGINDDVAYRPRPGVRSGSPSLNDAPLVLLRGLAAVTTPAQVAGLRDDTRALQGVLGDPQARGRVVTQLKQRLSALASDLAARTEQPGDTHAVTAALLIEAHGEMPLSFTAAESVAMSIATLVTAEYEQQRLPAERYHAAGAAIDEVYATIANERTYQPTIFVAALDKVASVLGQ